MTVFKCFYTMVEQIPITVDEYMSHSNKSIDDSDADIDGNGSS